MSISEAVVFFSLHPGHSNAAITENILYILDEPTTGLSFHDTALLLELLEELCSQSNSILIIEHDPDVLRFCDYIIELGPGGGNEGGTVVSFGAPARLLSLP